MPRREYILCLLCILYMRFWSLKLFSFIPTDGWTAITLGILVLCMIYYSAFDRRRSICNLSTVMPIIIILAGIFGSMITANMFYHQAYSTSLLTYKDQYLMIGAVTLLIMAPTQREVIKSLQLFAIVFTGVYIVRLLFPSLFNLGYDYRVVTEISIPGYELLCLLLFFYVQELRDKPALKSSLKFLWIFILLGLMQNRSSLIPAVICCGYALMTMKSRYRTILVAIFFCLIGAIIAGTWETWVDLYDQTIREVNDPDYNRNVALNYFLHIANPNIWCSLFGNGYLSSHTSQLMEVMMNHGVYNTDMGFIGYWNQFGIIPVAVFIYLILKTLIHSEYPLYLRMYAFEILLCSLTIMYFGQIEKIICFIYFFYLFEYYTHGIHQYKCQINLRKTYAS